MTHLQQRGLGRSIAVTIVLIGLSTSAVFAADAGKILSPDQITEKAIAQGYTKIIRMEMEDGVYEVKAKTADGKRAKLNVDPRSGKILGKHKDGLFGN